MIRRTLRVILYTIGTGIAAAIVAPLTWGMLVAVTYISSVVGKVIPGLGISSANLSLMMTEKGYYIGFIISWVVLTAALPTAYKRPRPAVES